MYNICIKVLPIFNLYYTCYGFSWMLLLPANFGGKLEYGTQKARVPESGHHIPAAWEVCHIPVKLALFFVHAFSDGFKPRIVSE